jgi:rhamnosyl/mannosyltransferase
VLFAGRLVHYKGVEFLIQALAELPADIQLLIVGRGPQEPLYRAVAAAAGQTARVRFLGRLGDDQLYPLYHACICFALPSTNRLESFGIVLAEAMACGAPVVSTDLGTGTSHVNAHGETGYVVPPGDAAALARAIGRLAGDGDLAAALGRRGHQRAHALFSPQAVVDATLAVYATANPTAARPG